MRLSFEKLFYRLRKEIVGLKREVIDVLVSNSETKVSSPSSETLKVLESDMAKCSEKSTHTVDISISDTETESLQSKKVKKYTDSKARTNKSDVEMERVEPGLIVATARPVLDFFNIQARVMPTQPFRDAQQFEDWNILLRNDEDQRDQLRVELMQGNFKEPEKYVIQTWRNIFHNDAAHHYSYRGTGRDKRAIKDYIFTDIFKGMWTVINKYYFNNMSYIPPISLQRYFYNAFITWMRNFS